MSSLVKPDIKQKAIKGFKWQAVNTITRQALTFLTGIILARLLTPADFGVISIAVVSLTWIGIIGDAGIGAAVIQKVDLSADDLNTAYWVTGGLGLVSAMCLVLASPLISSFYSNAQLLPILYVYSSSLILGGLNVVPASLLRRSLDFSRISLVEISGTLTSGLTALILASNQIGAISIPVGSAMGLSISLIIYWFMGLWHINGPPTRSGLKHLGSFSIFASGARIVELIRLFIDNASVGKFLGATSLGYYAFSYNLIAIPEYRIVGLVTTIAFPALAALQADIRRIRYIYLRILRYATIAVLPTLIGLFLVSNNFIPLVYGPKWLPAVPVLQILCFAGVGCSLAVITDSPLLALGYAKWLFRLNLVWVGMLCFGLGASFILGYGLSEVAFVVTGSAWAAMVLRNGFTARLCGVSAKQIAIAVSPALIGTSVMTLVVLFLQYVLGSLADWISLLVPIFTGTLIYALVILYLLPELQSMLLDFLQKRLILIKDNF